MTLLTTSSRILAAILVLFLFAACSSPGPGSNSTEGVEDFGEPDSNTPRGGSGDGGPNNLCSVENGNVNIIRVEVNVTSGMRFASTTPWQQKLFDLITPSKAYAFQGLTATTTGISLDVVRLNFQTSSSVSSDIQYEETFEIDVEDGLFLICFDGVEGIFQPEINVMIKAELPDGRVLYAPLRTTNGSAPLSVDVSTDFVVRRLFDNIITDAQLDELIDCPSTDAECPNQAREKALLLAGIAASADSFDIEFNDDDTVTDAINRLNAHPSYSYVVDQAVQQILRDPPSPLEEFDFSTNIDASLGAFQTCFSSTYSDGYSSSFFRIGVGDLLPDNTSHEVSISSAISDNAEANTVTSVELLPELSRTVFPVNEVRSETITPEIPFLTEQLDFSNGVFRFDSSDFYHFFSAPNNSFISETSDLSTTAIDRFLSNQGAITLDRTVASFIPNQISSDASRVDSGVGWSQDPVYSLLYSSSADTNSIDALGDCVSNFGNDPTWLTAAYFGSGNTYTQEASDRFVRNRPQESYRYYTWEAHGLRADESFSNNDINGKQYGVISFAVQLQSSSPFITLSTDISLWQANANRMLQTQPTGNGDHFESRSIERTSATETNASGPVTLSEDNRPYDIVESSVFGLINLDGGSSPAEGHASSNGSYLAFVQDNTDRGRGLILAMEQRLQPPEFGAGVTYVLQGNAFEMANEFNRARNITGSTLVLSEDPADPDNDRACTADITLEQITHQFSFEDPSPVDVPEDNLTATSSACVINNNGGGEIEIRFDSLLTDGEEVILKGFMAEEGDTQNSNPGNLMTLVWIEENGLGLVFAQKDLSQ